MTGPGPKASPLRHTESRETYEAYALCYNRRDGAKSDHFFRYGFYDEPDQVQGMDYYFWLLRSPSRTVLVDCGFDAERGLGRLRPRDRDPLAMLAQLDVGPGDVDHIVLSHLHFDHSGNLARFPNATVSLAREEYASCTGSFGGREVVAYLTDPLDTRLVTELDREERLVLVDGSAEVLPGIRATRIGGHTPGQMIVEVTAASGERLVLASDALHYYEELERDRPFAIFTGLEEVFDSYDLLRALDATPGTTVVAGHDPRVAAGFSEVAPGCVDLGSPIPDEGERRIPC